MSESLATVFTVADETSTISIHQANESFPTITDYSVVSKKFWLTLNYAANEFVMVSNYFFDELVRTECYNHCVNGEEHNQCLHSNSFTKLRYQIFGTANHRIKVLDICTSRIQEFQMILSATLGERCKTMAVARTFPLQAVVCNTATTPASHCDADIHEH